MKLKKATYLSLVLLSCFLLSTALGIVNSYISTSGSQVLSLKNKTVSSRDNSINIASGFNAVKTENENENDYEGAFNAQEFIIPVIFSFSGIESAHPVIYQSPEALVKESNPIYIAICNFRI